MATDSAAPESELSDERFGRLVMIGIVVSIPIAVILTTAGIYFGGAPDFGSAFLTAVWPGVLMGVFGGGFAGTAWAMWETPH